MTGRETVGPGGDGRRPHWMSTALDVAFQVFIVAGAAVLYFTVRGLTEGSEAVALRNAETLMRLEDRLGLDWESSAQGLILDNRAMVTLANWIYIWGHWPVIITVLIWLYVKSRDRYTLLFRAMLLSGAIGLVIFALFPVTPPRLLPDGDIVDTVTELSHSYRVLQPPALVNKYAAVPSLHVGWNLILGIVLFRATRKVPLRVFAVLSPALMMTAVVLTGNHFVIDGVIGSIVACTGLVVATWMARHTGAPEPVDVSEVADLPVGDVGPDVGSKSSADLRGGAG